MDSALLIASLMVAAAIAYVGFQLKNANRIAVIRLEFDRWNAPWTEERRQEFSDHVASVLKQSR